MNKNIFKYLNVSLKIYEKKNEKKFVEYLKKKRNT